MHLVICPPKLCPLGCIMGTMTYKDADGCEVCECGIVSKNIENYVSFLWFHTHERS